MYSALASSAGTYLSTPSDFPDALAEGRIFTPVTFVALLLVFVTLLPVMFSEIVVLFSAKASEPATIRSAAINNAILIPLTSQDGFSPKKYKAFCQRLFRFSAFATGY